MKGLLALLIAATFAMPSGYNLITIEVKDERERFACEVKSLEEYGFGGTEDEYVCVNPNDFADFVIVEGDYAEGDELTAVLNEDGATVAYVE